MRICLQRREFIAGLGGAAAWPLAARAQQADRVRRIGVLIGSDENDPLEKARISAFTQAFADLGWTGARNVRMDLRWGGGDTNRIRALARELVGLQPDIILTDGAEATVAAQRETRTIPIVFGTTGDPVASGIVARLDRPSCSRKSRPRSSGSQSCSILMPFSDRFICPHLRQRLGHSKSSQSLRPFIAT
jgi:putative ABC transport system substrate-binding protein